MWKLSENAEKVINERYVLRDANGNPCETKDELPERVASAVAAADLKFNEKADIEALTAEFRQSMENLEFLANTPTLMNAGTKMGQLSACFVLPVEDSMEGIFDAVKNAALIHKSGGGTGFSFTRIRADGSAVASTGGVASGPISFMKVFNAATDCVKQGGKRRGANMAILRVDHPQILDFIDCKKENDSLNNFNISVGITEDFMNAVAEGREYDLINPQDGTVAGKLSAKMVFDKIVDAAWRNGEPGIIFLDRLNRDNVIPASGQIEATNPCVTSDTPILTDEGQIPIGECVGKRVRVWNGKEFSSVVPKKTGADQTILELTFSNGRVLKCTPYHRFRLEDFTVVEAKDLSSGNALLQCPFPVIDGEKELDRAYVNGAVYGIAPGQMPDAKTSMNSKLCWLSGLIDMQGGVRGNRLIAAASYDKAVLDELGLLLQTMGVSGQILRCASDFMLHAGEHADEKKDRYALVLSFAETNFLKKAGLKTQVEDLDGAVADGAGDKIVLTSCRELPEKEDVYCFTEQKLHLGVFGGVLTCQCGEQPLLPYESCNLGSINLTKMLKETNGSYELDTEKLRKTVQMAVHFLDNVIEINRYPLPQIEKMTLASRKIGLGVMGFADMLLMLGIRYGSDEAEALAERIMKLITSEGRRYSSYLAEQRGPFPLYEESTLSFPQRNATITTIAPTGTLSIIANCSSGIEPVFAYAYIRKVMDTELIEVSPVLKAELKKRGLYSEELIRKVAEHGSLAHIDEIPDDMKDVFVSAHDITPLEHVKMQAAFQRHTDNAVSKTVNFPADATREDVAEVYTLAFTEGCKGVTIYRDGSRDQVLNIGSADAKKEEPEVPPAGTVTPRPRPEMLQGTTSKWKIGCGNLLVTVNCDQYGLCEVMTNTGKAGGCPSQSEATARLISIALRSGIKPEVIIDQLKGIRCPSTVRKEGMKCTSCPDAIARIMELELAKENELMQGISSYIPDISDETGGEDVCPECGSPLLHESGCVICRNCSYSKCG